MGFPSPAQDYIEPRLSLNSVFIPNPATTFRVDIPDGFLLVDSTAKVKPGNRIAYQWNGYSGLGKMYRNSLVTEEGEVIEGEPLNDVIVLGKVTCEVRHVYDDGRPTI